MDPDLLKSVKTLVKTTIAILVIIGTLLVVNYLLPYLGRVMIVLPKLLLPFLIAIILAYLIEPIVVFFEVKLKIKRGLAVLMSLIATVGGFSTIVVLVISKISSEFASLRPQLISYSTDIGKIVFNTGTNLRSYYLQMDLPPEVESAISNSWAKGFELMKNLLNDSIVLIVNSITFVPNILILIVISTIATFFLVKDRAVIRDFLWRFLSQKTQEQSRTVLQDVFSSLIGFVKAYSILVTITAVVTMIALKILGIKYAFSIGLITGILDVLPIVGTGLIFIPWIIWELFLGSKALGISLLVLYGFISIVRQILEPKITGDNIGLHPLATLLSMYVGLQLGGMAGLFLGPVLLVIVLAVNRAGFFGQTNWRNRL